MSESPTTAILDANTIRVLAATAPAGVKSSVYIDAMDDVFREMQNPAGGGFRAMDPILSSKGGGYAFLWHDVLDAAEICDILLAMPASRPLPNQLAAVVSALVGLWSRLRTLRVELNEDEFRVVRAVKSGRKTISGVAQVTELDLGRVDIAVKSLVQKRYAETVPVLTMAGDGTLATPF